MSIWSMCSCNSLKQNYWLSMCLLKIGQTVAVREDKPPKMHRDRSLSKLVAMNRRLETQVSVTVIQLNRFLILIQIKLASSIYWTCKNKVAHNVLCTIGMYALCTEEGGGGLVVRWKRDAKLLLCVLELATSIIFRMHHLDDNTAQKWNAISP